MKTFFKAFVFTMLLASAILFLTTLTLYTALAFFSLAAFGAVYVQMSRIDKENNK
jgi:hypothetical protein